VECGAPPHRRADPDLRDAAFGGRPEAWVHATPNDGSSRARWLAGVVLGGQGRYAAAATVLTGLLGHPEPVLSALAGTTLASHRRQLGAHAAARVLDGAALGRLASAGFDGTNGVDPDGVDAVGALDDALLGLVADAIGAGRLGEARRLFARTVRVGPSSWRSRVRRGWVGAELELAAGQPARAVPLAEAAAAAARSAGAMRHVVKSDLVLGAALATAGSAGAAAVLHGALGSAVERGLLPLVWPSALLLAELEPGAAVEHRERAGLALTAVLRAADPTVRRGAAGSPWLPSDLVRSGDNPGRPLRRSS
jgi:hypothetical protein